MWPFSRQEHPLPKFPPYIKDFFYGLCSDIPVEKLPELKDEFEKLKGQMLADGASNPLFDKKLAEKVFGACEILLEFYPSASKYQRKIIVGALKYCVATHDPLSDAFFASGLRDDAKIVNHVLEEIGKGDRAIILG